MTQYYNKMANFHFLKILLCLLLSTGISCNSNKDMKKVGTQDCRTTATVKDFTGLDGCTLLIVLDNGDKLLPAKLKDESFILRDGQRIKLDYVELDDVASICMAEKAAIEITCIELVEGRPMPAECFDTDDPPSVSWMKEVINSNQVSMIQKFSYRTDGWAYLFLSNTKQMLYDCQGTLLCELDGLSQNKCIDEYVEGAKGKTIYRKEG